VSHAVLVNGKPADTVSAADRGLMYGDGVFRTLLVRNGQPIAWARHLRKLAADCAALSLACPDAGDLLRDVKTLTADIPDCVIKLVVTRGVGNRGYAPPAPPRATRIALRSLLPGYSLAHADKGVAVRLCSVRLAHQPRLAGIKHLNRLENVLARMEWNDPAIAEGLMRDEAGNVVEGVMSNLFVCHNSALTTPDLSRCGVAGVTRERVLEWAARQGIRVEVKHLSLEEVLAADEVFLCNSVAGIWPVRELEGRAWNRGPLTAAAQDWLQQHDD